MRQGNPIWKLFQEPSREVRVQNKAPWRGGRGGGGHGFKVHPQGQILADQTCSVQDKKSSGGLWSLAGVKVGPRHPREVGLGVGWIMGHLEGSAALWASSSPSGVPRGKAQGVYRGSR